MKAIVLLVIGLALLGGAGYGGWMLYQKYIVGEAESDVPPPPPPPPVTSYVRMKPVVVPVIGQNRVSQFITVVVTIEVVAAKAPIAQSNVPRLEDAFITTLYGAVDDRSILKGELIVIPTLKAKLIEAATKTVGSDVVHDVLIQVVTQRNL
ncbi:hypothetical protein [Azospirillum halopraeferens]|uniref:hypothetical protein n=1 Tax=Azospirillum halopraeferens TaxID=34010 RepID=UPI00040CCBC3|nr:hypothetical protein [Azospirillum halopraeferens]